MTSLPQNLIIMLPVYHQPESEFRKGHVTQKNNRHVSDLPQGGEATIRQRLLDASWSPVSKAEEPQAGREARRRSRDWTGRWQRMLLPGNKLHRDASGGDSSLLVNPLSEGDGGRLFGKLPFVF